MSYNINGYESPVPSTPEKVTPNDDRHNALDYRLVPIKGKNRQLAIFRDASEHQTDLNATTDVYNTKNWGSDFSNRRTVFDKTDEDLRDHGTRLMDNGRIGCVFWRQPDGSTDNIEFLYSDDGGESWSSKSTGLTNPGPVMFIDRYPSSVGGADDGGWIIYSNNGNNDITYAYTTDNGDTWTTGVAISSVSGADLFEPCIARIGSEDKWVMIIRDNSGGSAWIAKSTDMLNWSNVQDTGISMGANPPLLHYFNGKFWWVVPSRKHINKEIDSYGNNILHQSKDANLIWDDLTAWPGWAVFSSGEPGNTTYFDIQKIHGRMVLMGGINETFPGSAQGGVYKGRLDGNKPVSFDHKVKTDENFVVKTR